jgi:methylmalonyl-CoA mutase
MRLALIKQRIEQFVKKEGRRPRILVSNLAKANHDHDTKLMATLFAEAGFDVDIGPLHQTPRGTARTASENDVHAICFLSTDNQHKIMATALFKALKAEAFDSAKILLGGTIPRSDYKALKAAGVDLILSSESADRVEVNEVLDLFEK